MRQLSEQKNLGIGWKSVCLFVCLFVVLVGFLFSLSDCRLFSSLSMISNMLFVLPDED